jgi:phospholipid/cholesterol/gamma-HCH transport system substrate-binding protein
MTLTRAAGVGAFVVGGFMLFAAALFLIGERRMLFARTFTVRTMFARVSGLEPGALVKVSGMPAGRVTDIAVPAKPSAHFGVSFQVREDLHSLVRTDSVASIQTEGLVGGTFLSVSAGTDPAARVSDGGSIPSREPFEVADLLQQMRTTVTMVNDTIATLRGDVETAVAEVAETAQHTDALLQQVSGDVESITASGRRMTTDVSEILTGLREGRGTMGRLLTDDELYRHVTGLAREAQATVTQARETVEEGRRAMHDLQSKSGSASGLMLDLREAVSHARGALANLEENTEALKRNFLFRGFFRRRGYFDLERLTVNEYRRGVLRQDGKRRELRIWLRAPLLFTRTPDGAEVLTDDGRARIESAMATFLGYPGDAPLIVEGYVTEGTAAEQFVRSRERAARVRDYLIAHFALDTRRLGVMPLGRLAPGSPDGSSWDGIALAMFVEPAALSRTAPADPVHDAATAHEHSLTAQR